MSLQATAKPGAASSGNLSMTAFMAEQLRPSLLAEVQIGTLSAAGQSLPGGLSEIITPGDLYMKWSVLTQELHTSKPWLAIPVSALSKSSGVDLSQLFSQATSASPLNESQLLTGASGVRRVGTGTIDGVPVTEYTGTVSLDKGMQYLTGSARAAMQKQITAAGHDDRDVHCLGRRAAGDAEGRHHRERHRRDRSRHGRDQHHQRASFHLGPAADQTTALPSGALGSVG